MAEAPHAGDAGRANGGAHDIAVRLLGPVGASRDGVEVPLGAAKHRMILATLALRAGETVSADVLIDTLWSERPPATASKALQVYVSELRKLLDPANRTGGVIQTRPGGYRLGIDRDGLDLARFEEHWERGRELLAASAPDAAAETLARALSLWQGEPLSDLRYETAFSADASRLEEMRLACNEDRIEADFACGKHGRLVGELETLVHRYPLRERLRGQLMLALYRSGRQADALSAYQTARDALVEQLGIDPSPSLVQLERLILQQDDSLSAPARNVTTASGENAPRTILVVSQSSADLDGLLEVAVPLAAGGDELVLARMLTTRPDRDDRDRLRELTRRLSERRDQLRDEGTEARVAAFSSADPGGDLAKLAEHQSAALLLVDGARELLEGRTALASELLDSAQCDVAFSLRRERGAATAETILVPFGGSDHDWAALELGSRLSKALAAPLVVAGSQGQSDRSDASRLLATASLILQRISGVTAEPVLIAPGAEGVLDAADDAKMIVIGLSPRYRTEGLGETRHAIIKRATTPSLFVRRGTQPGILTPERSMTRFRWSAAASQS